MEVDEIQSLSNKFPRRSGNSNGRIDPNRTFGDEEAEDGEIRRQRNNTATGGGGGHKVGGGATLDFTAGVGGVGRLCGWPSSRIVRVSRASGGKDRHSKVLTSKGLRDRRVRLSVNTAIQFYDLQDRLGYDQPSKAVEWLLKAATDSISELPPISTPFPDTPKQLSDDKRSSGGGTVVEHPFDSAEMEIEGGGEEGLAQQQGGALSKSACSSTSETSKGSGGLSLSRSESRLKARERARERAAKEKEEKSENTFVVQQQSHHQHQNVNSIPQNATFTELLTSGFTGTNNNNGVNHHSNNNSPNGSGGGGGVHESNFFQKSPRNWSAMAMDYFGGTTGTRSTSTHGFSGQIQLGNSMHQALATHVSSPFFTVSGDTNQELQPFSLIPEHYVPVVTTTGGGNNNHNNEYNLNFSISSTNSSGLAGFNRGTLQSNSSTACLSPQIQRFASTDNNVSSPSAFFLGTAPPPHSAVDNHHQQQHHFLPSGFDAGLQLFYGAGSRNADQKGKGKS